MFILYLLIFEGTICDGKGPKSCSTSCTDQVCRRFPAAQCQVHPCTCDVVFYDLVSNVPVDCDSGIQYPFKKKLKTLEFYHNDFINVQ